MLESDVVLVLYRYLQQGTKLNIDTKLKKK